MPAARDAHAHRQTQWRYLISGAPFAGQILVQSNDEREIPALVQSEKDHSINSMKCCLVPKRFQGSLT